MTEKTCSGKRLILDSNQVQSLKKSGSITVVKRIKNEPHHSEHNDKLWLLQKGRAGFRTTYNTNHIVRQIIDEQSGEVISEEEYIPIEEYMVSVCPYGKVGDAIWISEPWKKAENKFNIYVIYEDGSYKIYDKQTGHEAMLHNGYGVYFDNFKRQSKTSMPRWASRINAKIKSIKAEMREDHWFWILDIVSFD